MNVYAIRAFVKPEEGFNGRSFKGIVIAQTPSKAKERVENMLVKSLEVSNAKVTKKGITIKECKLYNDFFIMPQKNETK